MRRVGRAGLWLVLGFVFLRGVLSIAAEPRADAPAERARVGAAAPAFPTPEAEAFAVSFARAYLTYAPRRQEWVSLALHPYLAPGMPEDAGLRVPEEGSNQTVQQATVARSRTVDASHALVTVATTVANQTVTTRFLTVPVARDLRGGLAVYDLPSFAPPPPTAAVDEPVVEDLPRAEREAVAGVLERFFPAYFSGRTRDLAYFLPAGTRMRALPERYRLLDLQSVAQARGARAPRRTVLAVVEVRDLEGGATHRLRYRLALERRDRWYVAAVDAV